MAKFTFSREIVANGYPETFTASDFASFDEAKKAVDKGIHDRNLELKEEEERAVGLKSGDTIPATPPSPAPHTASGSGPTTTVPGPTGGPEGKH